MDLEPPVLVPPDDLPLERTDGGRDLTVGRCLLVAHNVAPDGKANPISDEDPYFAFVYQHGDAFFTVRGLNPEMMEGHQISATEADRWLAALPYRAPV